MKPPTLVLGQDLVKLIAEIDEFKGRWEALKTLSPDRLPALRRAATLRSMDERRPLRSIGDRQAYFLIWIFVASLYLQR